jgi:hypothetical protein
MMALQQDIEDLAAVGVVLAANVVELDVDMHEEEDREVEANFPAERTVWVRDWIGRREDHGWYHKLMVELEAEDHTEFKHMLRMEPGMFHEVVDRLRPRIQKMDTNYRRALSPGLKVAITLYFLASGVPYRTLAHGFRVPKNTIHYIVFEVCGAIYDDFGDNIKCPTTRAEWIEKSDEFARKWNWCHCLGAIDGKHIAIKKPPNSGSWYYNYKKFYSVILMAVVDARYKFMWVEVGCNGSASDAQIWNGSHFKDRLRDGTLDVPPPTTLPDDPDGTPVDWFLTGDDAFALRTSMMKPYSRRNLSHEERVFNYRLSRARRVTENAFGIISNRFQCLAKKLNHHPRTVRRITLACVSLHNHMRDRYPAIQRDIAEREDAEHNVIPGQWREGEVMVDMDQPLHGNQGTQAAIAQRDYLKDYYNNAGSVPWQDRMVDRHW